MGAMTIRLGRVSPLREKGWNRLSRLTGGLRVAMSEQLGAVRGDCNTTGDG